ncbi:MAG: hypothetical protein V3V09_05510 [Arenicellales bacterium]
MPDSHTHLKSFLNTHPLDAADSLFDLSDLGVVICSGADAHDFLQNQLSNDLSLMKQHQLSAYCSPKGRILVLFHVLKLGDEYALIAPQAVLDKTLPRLKMFIMRASVTLTQSEDIRLIGLHGASIPNEPTLFKHSHDAHRAFALCTENVLKETPLNSLNDWTVFDINQLLPQVFLENHEALIPQSVNLDIVDGVNFKKGCYPGQEIIARVKYRGKPKTRMINVQSTVPADIGTPIFIDSRESSAGLVISVAEQNGHYLMNISVPVTHLHEGNLWLDAEKTKGLVRLALPYEITV